MGRMAFYEAEGERSWVGRCCAAENEAEEGGEGALEGERRRQELSCGGCGRRCGGRGPKCVVCGRWRHLRCSGLSRVNFYAAEGWEEWRCRSCGGEEGESVPGATGGSGSRREETEREVEQERGEQRREEQGEGEGHGVQDRRQSLQCGGWRRKCTGGVEKKMHRARPTVCQLWEAHASRM